MRGVNLFPKVCEFILFLTPNLLGKYFVNDLLRFTSILRLKFVCLNFGTNGIVLPKHIASSQAIAFEHVSGLIYISGRVIGWHQ